MPLEASSVLEQARVLLGCRVHFRTRLGEAIEGELLAVIEPHDAAFRSLAEMIGSSEGFMRVRVATTNPMERNFRSDDVVGEIDFVRSTQPS